MPVAALAAAATMVLVIAVAFPEMAMAVTHGSQPARRNTAVAFARVYAEDRVGAPTDATGSTSASGQLVPGTSYGSTGFGNADKGSLTAASSLINVDFRRRTAKDGAAGHEIDHSHYSGGTRMDKGLHQPVAVMDGKGGLSYPATDAEEYKRLANGFTAVLLLCPVVGNVDDDGVDHAIFTSRENGEGVGFQIAQRGDRLIATYQPSISAPVTTLTGTGFRALDGLADGDSSNWYAIMLVQHGSRLSLYSNGTLVASADGAAQSEPNGTYRIGFSGTVDDTTDMQLSGIENGSNTGDTANENVNGNEMAVADESDGNGNDDGDDVLPNTGSGNGGAGRVAGGTLEQTGASSPVMYAGMAAVGAVVAGMAYAVVARMRRKQR